MQMRSSASRELKQMLSDLNLKPEPVIIEVEHRRKCLTYAERSPLTRRDYQTADEDVLRPLLRRLTSTTDIPILLVGGRTVGTAEEIRYLFKKGELARKMNEAGALVNGNRKKGGRKH